MKKIISFIIFITFFISCDKDEIIQEPVSEKYQNALDTLINYDNFFIGEFNGELLTSVEHFTFGKTIGDRLRDSVSVDFNYSYRIKNSEDFNTFFLKFTVYESSNKFESNNTFSYKDYNDFYSFFDRNEFKYYNLESPKNLTPEIIIKYIDYSHLINNKGIEYDSAYFDSPPFKENYFHIEKIKEIESPFKGVELTYSFSCTLFSNSNELIEIKNGKGKCTLRY